MTSTETHRLVVPAPDGGWLALASPREGVDRLALGRDWCEVTAASVVAAGLPRLGRVHADVEIRPQRPAPAGAIHVAEDVRPSVHQVFAGLVAAGVLSRHDRGVVVAESLTMGPPTGPAGGQGYLVLTLREVRGG